MTVGELKAELGKYPDDLGVIVSLDQSVPIKSVMEVQTLSDIANMRRPKLYLAPGETIDEINEFNGIMSTSRGSNNQTKIKAKVCVKDVECLRNTILTSGYSFAEFARTLEISRSCLDKVFRRNTVSPKIAKGICDILGVEFDELFFTM